MNQLLVDHPLIGTWITEDDDSDTAFIVSVVENVFRVSGFARSSGEPFEISAINWDGTALSFIARFPPTSTTTKNVFRIRPDGRADLELTLSETWKKKEVKPGDLPEAWTSQIQSTP